jgi:hypothetical protein
LSDLVSQLFAVLAHLVESIVVVLFVEFERCNHSQEVGYIHILLLDGCEFGTVFVDFEDVGDFIVFILS